MPDFDYSAYVRESDALYHSVMGDFIGPQPDIRDALAAVELKDSLEGEWRKDHSVMDDWRGEFLSFLVTGNGEASMRMALIASISAGPETMRSIAVISDEDLPLAFERIAQIARLVPNGMHRVRATLYEYGVFLSVLRGNSDTALALTASAIANAIFVGDLEAVALRTHLAANISSGTTPEEWRKALAAT